MLILFYQDFIFQDNHKQFSSSKQLYLFKVKKKHKHNYKCVYEYVQTYTPINLFRNRVKKLYIFYLTVVRIKIYLSSHTEIQVLDLNNSKMLCYVGYFQTTLFVT